MAVSRLLRAGYARPHVFVATVPGGAAARLAVDRYAREHGWALAASPADTDVVAVCGDASGWLADAVTVLWEQVPAPRARAGLGSGTDVATALVEAQRQLADLSTQRAGAAVRGHGDHSAHGAHEDGGHGGAVAGLPMAERGPDRDGLALDLVDVVAGPFLSSWPAGLRLRLTVQGDVVSTVAVDHEPAEVRDGDVFAGTANAVAAGRLDALGALLDVCGADGWALPARRLRDDLLAGADRSRELTRFAHALRRSRLLRASTNGVAVAERRDATARWRGWLDDAERALRGDLVPPLQASVTADELPTTLTGLELGGLRIAVASLVPPAGMPRLPAVRRTHERRGHG